ncbi:MAG: RHS repeat-associated core domain-containing protein [Candidatus Acidiferrum sp.]
MNQTVTAGSAPANSLTFATTPPPPANPPGGAYTNRPDGYTFDPSGNMLNDGINTLTYDAENCLISNTNSSTGTTAYTCDAAGVRVKKALQSGANTVYVFAGDLDIAEYDNGAAPASPSREFLYAGSDLVATISGSKTTYHHQDHLSARLYTDGTVGSPTYGQATGQQATYPFGESWYSNSAPDQFVFTSYQRDSESGNDYAMARYYISRFGRFCSADPLMGDPSDPQSWNRYAYVRNDPINMTDPSGQSWLTTLLSVLIDIFSAVTFQPEGIALGQTIGQAVGGALLEDVFMQARQNIKEAQQQGQQGQSQSPPQTQTPSGSTRPVYCDPNVMAAMLAAWNRQNPGNMLKAHSTEAGFPTYRAPGGGYIAGNGPAGQPPQIQVGSTKGFPISARTNAVDIFHTHPPGTSGLPSTPGNNAGENASGDTGSAVDSGKDIYVISDQGLSRAPANGPRDPKYNKNNSPWVVQGNGIDIWLPKLKKNCNGPM